MPPGAWRHGPPSAGTPGAGHPGHGHSHPHPFPLGGMLHLEMSQMQLVHHSPHGLGQPHAGPPGSGGQPSPQPPPGMPHPGHLLMSMPHPHQGPLFGSTVGLPVLCLCMVCMDLLYWCPLMDGYTGPPWPPPCGYQWGPFLHPDPLPGLQFPVEAHFEAFSLSDFSLSFLLL